jgi:exonuclease SbcD
MIKIKLLHLADLHIGMENYGRLDPQTGLNSRVMDFLRRFNEAIDYALENDIDLAIFAGDAYKSRDPNSTYRREFARRVKKLAEGGIPTVLLLGNHDLPSAYQRASSVEIFHTLEVENVIVARTEKVHRIETRHGPIQVATVPYPLRSRLLTVDKHRNRSIAQIDRILQDMVAENIRALKAELDPDLPAVLTAHFSVSGAKQGSEKSVMIGRDVVVLRSVVADPAFDYVALGHVHRHQDVNQGHHPPVVYAGSLERIDFGEEKEKKGFVVAEIEKGKASYEFHPVRARPFVTIQVEAEDSDPTEAVLRQIARRDCREAVVRIQIRTTLEKEGLIREKEIRAALKDACFIAAIHKEVERQYRQRLGGYSPEEMTPRQALEQYLEVKGTSPERIKTLLGYADRIFRGMP